MPQQFIRHFLKLESTSGIFLLLMACVAIVLDNSPLASFYQNVFNAPIVLHKSLLFWINEGLMSLFFLLVGLELKREFLIGELSQATNVVLPGIAALGGMIIPALIYVLINLPHPETLKGWAVPVATDIAFALGVLALFGSRVPLGLKLFLMSLAIFDDLGAILIIAFFYSTELSYLFCLFAVFFLLLLLLLNRYRVLHMAPYLVVGFMLWVCVLKSGVHATIAGVLLALMIPLDKKTGENISIAERLENLLHPWVAFFVMPLFALANAGISFYGLTPQTVMSYLSLGIILGLCLGKPIGVFSFSWVVIRMGWVKLPEKTTWGEVFGVSVLCGIGFTMSLFLGTLAFEQDNPLYLAQVRLGVLLGSTLSGVIGAFLLSRAFHNKMTGGCKVE